jgi:hypothetical protein
MGDQRSDGTPVFRRRSQKMGENGSLHVIKYIHTIKKRIVISLFVSFFLFLPSPEFNICSPYF